jgi:hypothetical protein
MRWQNSLSSTRTAKDLDASASAEPDWAADDGRFVNWIVALLMFLLFPIDVIFEYGWQILRSARRICAECPVYAITRMSDALGEILRFIHYRVENVFVI